ncbi:MAG TPA: ATPase [Planctomycetes bacterium]|nr:ATPase [Planctomycetota bacterium]
MAAEPAPWVASEEELLARLQTDAALGLSPAEAATRLNRDGPNLLRSVERQSAWEILLNQLKSFIVALLLAACVLSALFGDWLEAAAIGLVLVVNTLLGFLTELRAVRSMEALRQLGKVEARVVRGGRELSLPAQELVAGDVVVLEGGDVITADLRLLEASKLKVDESALTGESVPVSKGVGPLAAEVPLAERSNLLFKGTALTRGSGRAVVWATGMNTELGRIAALVAEAESAPTPLEVRLELLGRKLVAVALGVAALTTLSGILTGRGVLLMIETGIALAVAAIPEGLPVVATMALARGMWRLSRRGALIRKLPAVETLGATSVILTDKTGTLTENRMTVTRLVLAAEGEVELSPDAGFQAEGKALDPARGALREALWVAALCNNATLAHGEQPAIGDPLEVALLAAAERGGLRRQALLAAEPELREVAFDPALRMMATFHGGEGGVREAVKGGLEPVLAAATHELRGEERILLSEERRAWWLERNEALAARGLRILALASREVTEPEVRAYEQLTFLGLVALEDPPRAGVREAIADCRRAGIRVVMATGDQAVTGRAIAQAVGLGEGEVVTGGEVEAVLGDPERLARTDVFARVEPVEKLRLVEAFQASGATVAMTGDGVNDAPALQRANIGVAMGQRGTQVAREAADMVLQDDSFASIVVAVRQGRVIFANIRKFVLYLLSCNVAEIGVIVFATLLGLPLPLLPLQILFLNLVTDVFPALALGFGEGDPGTMSRPPRDPQEPMLAQRHWWEILGYAGLITVAVLGAMALALGPLGYTQPRAISVAFLTLGFAQLWHVFNMREPGSGFLSNDVVRNPHVWGSLGLCSLLLVATAYFAPLARVLAVELPDGRGWLLVLGASLAPWALGQLRHALVRRG